MLLLFMLQQESLSSKNKDIVVEEIMALSMHLTTLCDLNTLLRDSMGE